MKWLKLQIGGQRWGVFLVSPRSKFLKAGKKQRLGTCDFDQCKIFIDRSLAPPAREDTLLHELFHAALFVSGADCAYGRSHDVEEDIVGPLTPCFHRLLTDLGFQFPKGP